LNFVKKFCKRETYETHGKNKAPKIAPMTGKNLPGTFLLTKSFCGGPGGGFFKKSPLAAGGKYNISMDYLLCNRGTLYYKEKEGKDIMDEEIKEMLDLMSKVPLVRHSVMSYYQRFKLENPELIEKELTQKKGDS